MAKRQFSFFTQVIMFWEAVLVLPLVNFIAWVLPYGMIYRFSKFIGSVIYRISFSKRQCINDNLTIMFPECEYTKKELEDTGAIICGYELRIILEMISFSRMTFHEILSHLVLDNVSDLSKVVSNSKGSLILVTLHYGNWELIGLVLGKIGLSLTCVAERQFNPWIDLYLQKLRKKMGISIIYNEISAMKPLLSHIQKRGKVGLVADQTHWFDPLFIPFFGREAAVPKGPAQLAYKTHSQVFFLFCEYQGIGEYLLCSELFTDITYTHNKTLDTKTIMTMIYHKYEQVIKRDVKNWYSLGFPRWKLTKESLEEWKKKPDSDPF